MEIKGVLLLECVVVVAAGFKVVGVVVGGALSVVREVMCSPHGC